MTGSCWSVGYLPVVFSSILFITIITSFVIAVAQSDVTPWFPAISDTATKSPESNIFSQLVNLSSFLGLILIYIRYLQVKRDVEWLEGGRTTVKLNKYSLPVGLLSLLGCSVVANFPETDVFTVHVIGATTLFVFGNVYVWFQVVMSFYMKRLAVINSCVCTTRLILAIISTISLVLTYVMMKASVRKHTGSNLHWHSDDPGYTEHVIADAFEWLMAFCFLLEFITFTRELNQSRLQIRLVNYEDSYDPIPVQPERFDI